MAAVDPPKSPEPEKSPGKEGESCGERSGAVESGSCGSRKDVAVLERQRGGADRLAEARGSSSGGGSSDRPELSDGSSATRARIRSCVPPEDLINKKSRSLSSNNRTFDWSESEELEEEAKTPEEAAGCDPKNDAKKPEVVQRDSRVNNIADNAEKVHEKKSPFQNEKTAEKSPCEDMTDEEDEMVDAVEDDDEAAGEDNTELSARNNNLGMICKDCGMKFERLEMFNLHRHLHTQEDELTCKECGLSFQDSSSLIKHKNTHKEKKEEQVTFPKTEIKTKEEGSFQCAECQKMFSTVHKLRDHNCSDTVEKPYHCPLCRQEFQFKVSVTKHMMSHSQESIFTCQECNQSFANTTALRIHQRSHSALKPYECPDCGMVFKHYYVMEDHRRRHTDSTHSHLCNICGKTFKYTSLFHQHQYLHTGQKPFRCPQCGKKFAFAQNLKAHSRQHRKHVVNSVSEQSPDIELEQIQGLGKENTRQSKETNCRLNCPVCPQTFSSSDNLRAHMFVHEAENETLEKKLRLPNEIRNWEKGHTCPHCPCIYRDESSLNVHILSVHKPLAYLEKLSAPCNQQLSSLNNSESAKAKSHGTVLSSKSHKCSECGKSFRHRSVLELHMRIHSKVRPYQCKVCGKEFRCSSYLQQHVIIHTGKKPYKCPECGKDFAFLQNMKTHQKLHQEKPFRCTSCRKGYSDESQLQHHMLSHNGDKPHKCDMCDKSFGLAYLLRDHMNTHTGERPHRCEECHKSFSWFSSLLVHQKIHVRKRQSLSHYGSLQTGARMRGKGSRGRRGGRFMWGQMRSAGGSGIANRQEQLYPVSAQRDAQLNKKAVDPPSSLVSSSTNTQSKQQKEPPGSNPHRQPAQWKVDGGEVMPVLPSQQQQAPPQQTRVESPILLHQRSGNWADVPHSGSDTVQSSDSSHIKESKSSAVSSHPASVPVKSSTSAPSEIAQHRQQPPVTWSKVPTSIAIASTSSGLHGVSIPSSYGDGAALWSVRPALLTNSQSSLQKQVQELQPTIWSVTELSSPKDPSTHAKEDRAVVLNTTQSVPSTVSQPEKPWNGCEPPKPLASCSTGSSTSALKDQSTVKPVSTTVPPGVSSTVWSIKAPPGIPNVLNSTDTKVNTSDFQLPVQPGWANLQTAQKVPISIHYEPRGFGQRIGTPVWGFQSSPVAHQTLLTAQLKAGTRPELQPQPLVTGTQIIINQASPFFTSPLAPIPPLALPGPHPLHSVAVGALQRPPQPKIFFAPQAVMSETPHMPQTLPLPQLALQTEPPKLGPRLHFPPERLLQCMICGCSLPRELDLQMHYLQHAQGEI